MNAFLILLHLLLPHASEWTLADQEEGIEVYTRVVPGETLKATRAVTEVEASLEELLRLITDPNESIHWMDRVESARIIRREGDNLFWVHNYIGLPWPLDDRDLVVRVEILRQGSSIIIEMKNAPGILPEMEDVVRMPKYEGRWILEPISGGRIKVISESFSDVGGSIPDWLKGGVVDSAILTMRNLRAYVED